MTVNGFPAVNLHFGVIVDVLDVDEQLFDVQENLLLIGITRGFGLFEYCFDEEDVERQRAEELVDASWREVERDYWENAGGFDSDPYESDDHSSEYM